MSDLKYIVIGMLLVLYKLCKKIRSAIQFKRIYTMNASNISIYFSKILRGPYIWPFKLLYFVKSKTNSKFQNKIINRNYKQAGMFKSIFV